MKWPSNWIKASIDKKNQDKKNQLDNGHLWDGLLRLFCSNQ